MSTIINVPENGKELLERVAVKKKRPAADIVQPHLAAVYDTEEGKELALSYNGHHQNGSLFYDRAKLAILVQQAGEEKSDPEMANLNLQQIAKANGVVRKRGGISEKQLLLASRG